MTHQANKISRNSMGSMTLAMQAVRKDNAGPKVLRVGVIEQSRITEERVFRTHETVTMGRDPTCTFTIGALDALAGDSDTKAARRASTEHADESVLPEKAPVFVWRSGGWCLVFTAQRDGRVVVNDRMCSLSELIASGQATACDEGFEFALSDNSRGKVTVGKTSLLFQFVEAPPVATKPQLPSAIRAQPLRGMDWTYNACLSGFLAMAFCTLGYVEIGYDPEIETMTIAEEMRIVHLATAPVEEPPPADPQQQAAQDHSQTPQPNNTQNTAQNTHRNNNTPRQSNPRPTQEEQANRAIREAGRASEAVMNGLQRDASFRSLVNAANGPHSATAMIENGQALLDGSVEQLRNVGGIHNATSNEQGIHRNGIVASNDAPSNSLGRTNRVVGPTEIGTPNTVVRERVVTSRVTPGPPDLPPSDPTMPMNEVAAIFRRNIGAIQSCYVAGLRDNPGLRGRVMIEFSIGTSGRVLGTPSVSGLDNAERVHQCMAARVRAYVFPVLAERAEVSFPVNVAPGN